MNLKLREKENRGIDIAKFLCSILVIAIHVKPFNSDLDTGILNFINFAFNNILQELRFLFSLFQRVFSFIKKQALYISI